MRSYQTIIHEAELLASPPTVVVDLLRNRSAKTQDYLMDKETEAALARRDEPLINLALARYACYGETLRPLFEAGVTGGAILLPGMGSVPWPAQSCTKFWGYAPK